jgi:hypothetical protein
MRVLQHVVEQTAEVGLDYVKLAPSHGHNLGKVVDDLRTRGVGPARCNLGPALLTRAANGLASAAVRVDQRH